MEGKTSEGSSLKIGVDVTEGQGPVRDLKGRHVDEDYYVGGRERVQ